jgi:glycolate oxidase iron-sulfur subunit
MARTLQERKVAHIRETGAEAVVTANPGCIIQIAQGLGAAGSHVEVLHIAEILDEAYRNASTHPSPSKGERAG